MPTEYASGSSINSTESTQKRARLDEGLAFGPAEQQINAVAAILAVGFLRLISRRPWMGEKSATMLESAETAFHASEGVVPDPSLP